MTENYSDDHQCLQRAAPVLLPRAALLEIRNPTDIGNDSHYRTRRISVMDQMRRVQSDAYQPGGRVIARAVISWHAHAARYASKVR